MWDPSRNDRALERRLGSHNSARSFRTAPYMSCVVARATCHCRDTPVRASCSTLTTRTATFATPLATSSCQFHHLLGDSRMDGWSGTAGSFAATDEVGKPKVPGSGVLIAALNRIRGQQAPQGYRRPGGWPMAPQARLAAP